MTTRVYYSSCEYGLTFVDSSFRVDACECCAQGEHLDHHARIEFYYEAYTDPVVIVVGTYDSEAEAIDRANQWLWEHYRREYERAPVAKPPALWERFHDLAERWQRVWI